MRLFVSSDKEDNKLRPEDEPIHAWYRFVLSFPPHLVRQYVERFDLDYGRCVLDPFCGTGTTLVECKKRGLASVGIEAIPMAHFASRVKTDWQISPDGLIEHARQIARDAAAVLASEGLGEVYRGQHRPASQLRTLPTQAHSLLIKDSISPLPLHRTLTLLDLMRRHRDERYLGHALLALANILPTLVGNLRFGPEVGVGKKKADSPVVALWLQQVQAMAYDLRTVEDRRDVEAVVHCADAREPMQVLEPNSIDAVITSPPYPNEKDYTRIVRLESVLLGFMADKRELRATKDDLLRSNTRNVYKGDQDDRWVAEHQAIQRIAEKIETRRTELKKDSGFERLYSRATKLYFGGMARHLAEMRTALVPGAGLAYVVGDQASYLKVLIRTGELLADIASSLGYEVLGIDLFRTRIATATREQLREEVVLLRWPG